MSKLKSLYNGRKAMYGLIKKKITGKRTPVRVSLLVTKYCNLECFYCYAAAVLNVKEIPEFSLDEFKDLYVCVSYKLNGKKIDYLPSALQDQIKVKPVYKRFDGWLKSTSGVKQWKKLPKNAQKYVSFIKKFCNVKISSVSTSPKREDTILLENPFK